MIGIVVVSHSARLAEGVCELAAQVAQGKVRIAAAGGTTDAEHSLGTDTFRVQEAIESVYSDEGVLVLMDLGSAILSAETAIDLLDENRRSHVRLCAAPLVEGAVAAAALAAAGAGLDEVALEAGRALAGKVAQLGEVAEDASAEAGNNVGEDRFSSVPLAGETACPTSLEATLVNPLGLHARPAAEFVRLARKFEARIVVRNKTLQGAEANAASINAVLGLGARGGHTLAIRAQGPHAREAVAALKDFIEGGCGDRGQQRPALTAAAEGRVDHGWIAGIAASSGIGIGPIVKLRPAELKIEQRRIENVDAEQKRLSAALSRATDETRALYEWTNAHGAGDRAGIFDAQLLFLEDPELAGAASRAIAVERINAEAAWQNATEAAAARLRSIDDPYLRLRAGDVEDVAGRVMRGLTGQSGELPALQEPSVIVARDMTPSDVSRLDRERVVALCLEGGAANAHSAILARAIGIPAVVGLGAEILAAAEGTIAGVDGDRGGALLSPGVDQIRELEERRNAWLEARRAAEAQRKRPAATRDGRRIRVIANISGVDDARLAVEKGAEGVGVLRTEFLFLERESAPCEQEQLEAYMAIATALGGRPLVIRTLDIGGDKRMPYIDVGEEDNPFLGWRGTRLLLDRRDLLDTQLRAILRATREHPVEILLPMIATLSELRRAKAAIREVEAQLEREGVPFRRDVRTGIMIEVPAAVAIADQLSREASFFSIGSNDLIQYAMAADRTNARVAASADPLEPAVLRLISQTVAAAREAGIEVALCGELAADPVATPLLLGFGVEEFSVSPQHIPELKQAIGRWSFDEAREIARRALSLDSGEAVRRMLA